MSDLVFIICCAVRWKHFKDTKIALCKNLSLQTKYRSAKPVIIPPVFTPVFKSINVYRQIYIAIQNWFSIGNYDLGKDELLLSFISAL